jgi:signal transduction histidine kinase
MLAGSPEAVAALQEGQQTPLKPPLAAVAGAVAQQHGRTADLVLELLEASVAVAEDFLRKMAEELVDNAFKFSAANTPVKMGATVLAGEVVVSVTDEGPGMTSEQVARLETHQQFARKLKARQGIGLGLALAKRLAELHGGALLVQTEVGRGTTMLLRLPAAR